MRVDLQSQYRRCSWSLAGILTRQGGDGSWSVGDCAEPGSEVGFDVDPGNNELPKHFGVPDASACLDHCVANARCHSAIFSKTDTQTTGGCYLKEQPHTAKVAGKMTWTAVWCNPPGALALTQR